MRTDGGRGVDQSLIPTEGWAFLLLIVIVSVGGAQATLSAWSTQQAARGSDIEACETYCAEQGGELGQAVVLNDKLACRCVFP